MECKRREEKEDRIRQESLLERRDSRQKEKSNNIRLAQSLTFPLERGIINNILDECPSLASEKLGILTYAREKTKTHSEIHRSREKSKAELTCS